MVSGDQGMKYQLAILFVTRKVQEIWKEAQQLFSCVFDWRIKMEKKDETETSKGMTTPPWR
jgi:hypothetical protein